MRASIASVALSLLIAPGAASADSVSGSGLFNKKAECNFTASAGDWHVVSSTFSVKENVSPSIARLVHPAYVMMVYDPLTQPGFRLADVMGYEKRWGSYAGNSKKNQKFLNYTGQWPFKRSQVGSRYRVGREPIVIVYIDPFEVSLQVTIPPGYRQPARSISNSMNGIKATFTDDVLGDDPTLMTLRIGNAAPQLFAADGVLLKRNRFREFRGKNRISNAQDQLADMQFVSRRVPTYTKTINYIREQLRREQDPDFQITKNAAGMLAYFLQSAQSESDGFELAVVEKGRIISAMRLPGFRPAARLFQQGLDHYGANLFNARCW
ncbi:MAG: hypothetical protein AAF251_13185 [Pseudomonadota bacterium]